MFGGKPGVLELVIILVIVLLVFGGRGKISSIMGDVGSGLKAFRKSVKDDEKKSENEEDHIVEDADTTVNMSSEDNEDIKNDEDTK